MESRLKPLRDREEFLTELRAVGNRAYHDKHSFHKAMNAGRLTADQLRGWVANRFHYQRQIPIKDAAILANCPLPEVRRLWIRRIGDHDGAAEGEGRIEAWLLLSEAVGLTRAEVWDERHVLPGVRFAVEAYVQLARTSPWPVAVAASLTELFAPDLMTERLRAFEKHYSWVPASGLSYFRARLGQARVDAEEGLRLTLTYCSTAELQLQAVMALERKCDILWAMLDSIRTAYGAGPEPCGNGQSNGALQSITRGDQS
jgi:pyrroloquinoline-quinone synthase